MSTFELMHDSITRVTIATVIMNTVGLLRENLRLTAPFSSNAAISSDHGAMQYHIEMK